jgi:hypothetical protein
MVHAPSVGANAIDGAMDNGFVCGILRLRCTEAQPKDTGKIQPVEADDEVCFFD